jgi:hypothetical protein
MSIALTARSTAGRARFAALLAAIASAGVVALFVFRHSQDGVFGFVLRLAAWFKGGPVPQVVTWPAWGYPLLIASLPSLTWVVALQLVLGSIALAALAWRLRALFPRHGVLLMVLCVLALPWHDLQATLYPSAIPGSLMILGLLRLDAALDKGSVIPALVGGVLLGLAQNFRTEFVLMPLFLGICLCSLRYAGLLRRPVAKPLLAFILVAFAFQLPWAFFYHSQTGRYSLTESNLGHVLYVSLGSNPHNPWGIEASDASAAQVLDAAGYSFSSLSDQGSHVLLGVVREDVRLHPWGLIGRTLQQVRNTALAPFTWGEPRLSPPSARDLDVLRQELKAKLGIALNSAKLREYGGAGVHSQAQQDLAAQLALLYQALTVGLGSLILLLGIAGMIVFLLRPAQRPLPPLLCLLGGAALFKLAQDALLFYQVTYLNNVYPAFLPFVVISTTAIADRLRRAGGGDTARVNDTTETSAEWTADK